METSEFAMELRKTEKDNVMENSYACLKSEKQLVIHKFFKIGVLKIPQISQEKSWVGVTF